MREMEQAEASEPAWVGSDWRDFSREPLPPLLLAARDAFRATGYHGTTVRQLAAQANLSVPGLYHHYPSKQAMLVAICRSGMSELWDRSHLALADAGDDVDARFDRLIECLVIFHAHRRDVAFIAANEIRSLHDVARAEHIQARDRQQRLMDQLLEEGLAAGRFTTAFPRDASRAVVTMCTGVSQWYRPGGELAPGQLAERYITLARGTVGATERPLSTTTPNTPSQT